MRSGKYDKFLLIFLTIVFFYSFFSIKVVEIQTRYIVLDGVDQGKKYYVIPTSLFITPPFIIFLFGIMVFEDKLKDFSIKRIIIRFIILFKEKIKKK